MPPMKGEGLITIPDLVLFYSTLLLAKAQWQIIEIRSSTGGMRPVGS